MREQLQCVEDIKELMKLANDCLLNKELFEIAIEKKYFEDDTKEKLEACIAENKKKERRYKTLFKADNFKVKAKEICKDKKDSYVLEVLTMLKEKITSLKINIQAMEKGNELLQAMSNLVAEKAAFIEYKQNGNKKCPLCGGTDGFSKVSDEELCSEAQAYIDETNNKLVELKIELKQKEKCYQSGREQFQNRLLSEVIYDKERYKNERNECNTIMEALKDYYQIFTKYQLEVNQDYLENIDETIVDKQAKCVKSEKLESMKNELKQLFSIVEYKDCLNY